MLSSIADNACSPPSRSQADGGFSRMWLETSRRQKSARKLYVRNGWELLESIDNSYEDDLLGKDLLGAAPPKSVL